MTTFSNGYRTFYTLVTDLSGNGVTGQAANINVDLVVNGTDVSTSVVEVSGSSVITGLYEVQATINGTGNGYIAYSVDDPASYDIVPDFERIVVTENDADNVFALVRSQTNLPNEVTVGGNFSRQFHTVKLNDAFIEDFTISAAEMRQSSDDLTGWTDFEFEVFATAARTASTSAAYTGTATVTNTSNPATIDVVVPAISGDIIDSGFNSVTYYADLHAKNPSGYRVTFKEVVLEIVRDY